MIETLNKFEIELIETFQSLPLFTQIENLPQSKIIEILIQRRFLSLSIVNIYEFVIDALTDEATKQTVRSILSEEFPRTSKGEPLASHRELLFQDIQQIGANAEQILTTIETSVTQKVRNESYYCLIDCLKSPYSQVGLVTFLRFWAEVLVSVEYTCLWKRISSYFSTELSSHIARSEFYYFHMIHDARGSDIGTTSCLGGLTHSQELAIHLKNMITSQEILDYSLSIEKKAYSLKSKFYDQF